MGVGSLGLVDRPDHVKGALGIVLELIVQDTLTAVDRVLQADVLSLDATELLGREKGLGQKSGGVRSGLPSLQLLSRVSPAARQIFHPRGRPHEPWTT